MSRCFPFPPPGYQVNRCGSGNEALIESIKLQREREQAKAERKKEKKREKKEKRKEKKDKANRTISDFYRNEKDIKKVEERWANLKDVKEEESEPLERSTLTEEHDQPICLHNPSSSSDDTQQSNKRKRHPSPAVVQCEDNVSRGPGNIIRIRLSSKRKQDDVAVCREEPCSTSGRVHLSAQRNHISALVSGEEKPSPRPWRTNDVVSVPLRVPDREQICSTSGKSEAAIGGDISISGYKKPDKKLRRMERQYKDLIENWVPPSLPAQLDFDDEDWFIKRKRPQNHVDEKLKSSKDVSCCSSSSSSLWPRAQLLPDADIYALPFTVPF